MKIAMVHNFYQQPGGEDASFATERALLENAGHRVVVYTRRNEEINRYSAWHKLGLLRRTVWADDSARAIRDLLRREQPDVVHFQNTFPLVSPAAYYAARREGVPVVQTLRNYRLFCLNGLFFRDGRICEDCLGKFVPWPGVVHGTYRNSRLASGLVATMLVTHRILQTWTKQVDVYVALTEFARGKFIQGGLPAGRILVKPNAVHPDPGLGEGRGGYALFAGRLSPEKGVDTILAAWRRNAPMPLVIVGDGPLAPMVREAAAEIAGVEWLGWLPRASVFQLMKDAAVLLFPSVVYETLGNAMAEAFATGLPVIASNLGSMASLVEDGRTGRLARPGDAADLARQVEWVATHPDEMAAMRQAARRVYEAKFAPQQNYQALMQIYAEAIKRAQDRRRRGRAALGMAMDNVRGAGSIAGHE